MGLYPAARRHPSSDVMSVRMLNEKDRRGAYQSESLPTGCLTISKDYSVEPIHSSVNMAASNGIIYWLVLRACEDLVEVVFGCVSGRCLGILGVELNAA